MGKSWKNFEAQERKCPRCFHQAVGRSMHIEVAPGEGSEGEKQTEEVAM